MNCGIMCYGITKDITLRLHTSDRSIKKINAEPSREEKKQNEHVVKYNEPLFQGQEPKKQSGKRRPQQDEQLLRRPSVDNVDFEKKLEESLKDL